MTLALLLLALSIAAATDVARRRIYNWTTYPGILGCAGAETWDAGADGLQRSFLGLIVCGGVLLAAFALFDVGGGDVKLGGLIGAGLGWLDGLLALLWTFTLAAMCAVALLIWRYGAFALFRRAAARLRWSWRGPGGATAAEAPTAPLQQPLWLAPAALAGAVIARWDVLARLVAGS